MATGVDALPVLNFVAALERAGDWLVGVALDATNPLSQGDAPECWGLPLDHPHHTRDRDYAEHPIGCTCND